MRKNLWLLSLPYLNGTYLLGKHSIIRTDKKSLKFLLEQRVIGLKYQMLVCKLLGSDFEIHYKLGQLNTAVDALF